MSKNRERRARQQEDPALMSQFLISAAAFVVAIGLLVAVHEFGHYWVARRLGIKVLRFSIGFGKPIWRRVAGADATEYVISSIPLGGYVKMLDEREGPVPGADRGRAFNHKPIPARIAVLVAGPAFNFLFAIAAYWLMFVAGVPGLKPVIGEVAPDGPAAQAGLLRDDRIVAVGDVETATWEGALLAMLDDMLDDGRIRMRVVDSRGSERSAVIDVADRTEALTEPGALFPGLGLSAWAPEIPARIESVEPGGAGERGGLLPGDLIVAAGEERIETWNQWRDFVRARPGETVSVRVERAGRQVMLALDIGEAVDGNERIGMTGTRPVAPEGIGDHMIAEQRYGPLDAIGVAVGKTWDMTALTLRMFWRMLTGDVSLKNISGPINIAQYAGYTAAAGGVAFLSFLAIVSISLGILNLLPIPVLDGGQIAFQLAEAVKGSPLSQRAEIVGQQIGLFLLLMLMSFAFYNDIARLVS